MRFKRLLMMVWLLAGPGLATAQQGPPEPCGGDGERPCATQLPEPETLALLGVGAVALFVARRRNKK